MSPNIWKPQLSVIQQRQNQLRHELRTLDAWVGRLTRQLESESENTPTLNPSQVGATQTQPAPVPPREEQAEDLTVMSRRQYAEPEKTSPHPSGQPTERRATPETADRGLKGRPRVGQEHAAPWPEAPAARPVPPTPTQPEREAGPGTGEAETGSNGLEAMLGQVWFVRVGVLLLLTGLVFLGHLGYTHFIMNWSPMARSLVVLALSAAMGLAGRFAERGAGENEGLRRFGQVLGAAGPAGIFFGIYAGHHVEAMRWITSPLLTGALLLGWTGVMGWMADRRRSELFAGMALLLSYYTVVVTPIAEFTLVAGLIISCGAVFFLFRHGWSRLSLAAMPLSYGAFGFWQIFYQNGNLLLNWPPDAGAFPQSLLFLGAYWLVFTAAVLLPRNPLMQPRVRAVFAGINNLSLFVLGALTMPQETWQNFWLWPFGIGVLLVGLTYVARHRLPEARELARVYFAEGLILLTGALIIRLQGLELALLLALQASLLQVMARFHWRGWYRAWAGAVSGIAAIAAVAGLDPTDYTQAALCGVVALILVIHAVFLSNRSAEGRAPLSLWALYHSGLSVLLFLAMLRVNFEPVDRVLLPALSAVGLLATLRGHKVRELAVMGLLLMLAAHLQMLLRESFWIDWPLPLALAVITGVYANYWLRDTMVRVPVVIAHIKQAWFSLAELLLLTATLLLAVPDPAGSWLWILLFLMVVMPLRANFLGSAWPAWAVQVYLPLVLVLLPVLSFPSLAQYTNLGPASGPHWWALLGILCVSQAVARLRLPWRSLDPGELSLQAWSWWKGTVRVVFPWVASAVYVGWVFCELPRDYWMLTFGLSALALGLFSSVFQRVFLFRLAWGLSILSIIFSDFHVTGWDALGMLAILLFQITSRYLDKSAWGLELPRVVPRLSVSVALVVLFVFVSREVLETADFALTLTFGVYGAAVLALGFGLSDRLYRLWGFGFLTVGLGRLLFMDLWTLGLGGRTAGCLALGALLVLLGYLYNRFPKAIGRVL